MPFKSYCVRVMCVFFENADIVGIVFTKKLHVTLDEILRTLAFYIKSERGFCVILCKEQLSVCVAGGVDWQYFDNNVR